MEPDSVLALLEQQDWHKLEVSLPSVHKAKCKIRVQSIPWRPYFHCHGESRIEISEIIWVPRNQSLGETE